MSKINSEYVAPKVIAKLIKPPLVKRFGRENVSVRCGSGTAYGWLDVRIDVAPPGDCFCEPRQPYCTRCIARMQELAPEARTIVRQTMEEANAKFSTYIDDMNGEHEEFLLQISIRHT